MIKLLSVLVVASCLCVMGCVTDLTRLNPVPPIKTVFVARCEIEFKESGRCAAGDLDEGILVDATVSQDASVEADATQLLTPLVGGSSIALSPRH